MSTNQDASQKFHQYDSGDRQLLVGLLHEYSDKLVESSRTVARIRGSQKREEQDKWLPLLFFSAFFSYGFSRLILYVLETYLKANKDSSRFFGGLYLDLMLNWFQVLFSSTFVLFCLVLLFVLKSRFFDFFYFNDHHRLRKIENDLLERDARMIANRLESAMRLTVEIADRVETNLARKLELELRIDDASSALEYYYSVVNPKSKSQSTLNKVVS